MPGFIIHLAEAGTIIDYMEIQPDAEWRRDFLLGSLLPDTRLGPDKELSHFWDRSQDEYIARAPKLSLFLDKYGNRLDEPLILGYYAHLFLDERYVNRLWPRTISFEDEEGCPEPRRNRITQVEVKRSGQRIPFDSFFSSEYYYGDYTRSNHWFVERFHIQVPAYRILTDLKMDEVKAEEIERVLKELRHLCGRSQTGDEKGMRVFDLTELETFVRQTAEAFCTHVAHLMHI